MRIENFGNVEVNVDEALQALLGETKIEQEDGYYVLKFDDQGEHLDVTVEYDRTKTDAEKGFTPLGFKSVFNESYNFDPYAENTFSFKQLVEDLHSQHLESVENWLMGFLEEKFSLAR